MCITTNHCEDVPALKSNHEEADTRLLLHAKQASRPDSRIVIESPDTDVLVLSVAHFNDINCEEMWFRIGVKDQLRYIPVHDASRKLGETLCRALPAFHAMTGCDTTSALAGIGKKKACSMLCRSQQHQESLGLLGDRRMDKETVTKCEAFICDLYTCPKQKPRTSDELRYVLFCQKKQKSETLPPTSDSLLQHLKRANYQIIVWGSSIEDVQHLPPPEDNRWDNECAILKPVLMTKEPAPRSLLELTTYQCKKSRCQSKCSSNSTGLSCTESSFCMADTEWCKNPHGVSLVDYSGDSD